MKKKITLLLSLAVFLLTGCGQKEMTLYDRGLEVTGLMVEAMQSEAYLDMLSAAEPMRKILAEATGNYQEPQMVYSLSFADIKFLPGTLSEDLTEVAEQRLMAAAVSQVNAMGGVEILAASTMCTVGKTFVSHEMTDDLIYLYVFEDGYPVAVTFITGEDSTVTATANVILYPEFPTGSAGEIREFFGGEGVEVTDITRK